MFRTSWVWRGALALALSTGAACASQDRPLNEAVNAAPPAADTSVVQPSGAAGAARLAEIQAARKIDPCALFGAATAVAGRQLSVIGSKKSISCEGRLADPKQPLRVSVALNAGPRQAAADANWVKHPVIDGVPVSLVSALDGPHAPPRDQVVTWTCNLIARFRESTALIVIVDAPRDADGCAAGQELMRTALHAYAKRPLWGSTRFPRTVVSGADPCVPVARLKPAHTVVWDIDNSSSDECSFLLDGSPKNTAVTLDSTEPEYLEADPDRFEVGGRQFSGRAESGAFDVVIGPAFEFDGKTLAPVATVTDLAKDMDRIRLVAGAVANSY